jgi:hypothetical protein
MKVQIYSKNNQDVLVENLQRIEIEKISEGNVAPNDSIEYILVDGALSRSSEKEFQDCLNFCADKLRINGECVIQDLDLEMLAHNYNLKNINNHQFTASARGVVNFHSLGDIRRTIEELKKDIVINEMSYMESSSNYTIKFTKI